MKLPKVQQKDLMRYLWASAGGVGSGLAINAIDKMANGKPATAPLVVYGIALGVGFFAGKNQNVSDAMLGAIGHSTAELVATGNIIKGIGAGRPVAALTPAGPSNEINYYNQ